MTDEAPTLWNRIDDALRANDIDSATFLLRALAKEGDHRAIALIGLLYEYETPSRRPNKSIALAKYRESVFRADDPLAHFGLARAYFGGEGVVADRAKAAWHMSKAADMGFPEAALYFGLFLKSGYGVNRDENRAIQYFRAASEHGYLAADANIARWELRNGRFFHGLAMLTRASVRAFRLSIHDPFDRRLLLTRAEPGFDG